MITTGLFTTATQTTAPKLARTLEATPVAAKRDTTDTTSSGRASNHSSPPPVAYSPQSTSVQPMTSSQESKSSSIANGGIRRMSSASDDFVLVFSEDISGMARDSPTGNVVRDRCRDLIAKAFKKGFENRECFKKGFENRECSVYCVKVQLIFVQCVCGCS